MNECARAARKGAIKLASLRVSRRASKLVTEQANEQALLQIKLQQPRQHEAVADQAGTCKGI